MDHALPDHVARVLLDAGWPGRGLTDAELTRVVEFVGEEVGSDGATLEAFPAAIEALKAFGGLYVVQDGPGRDLRRRPFATDPTRVAASTEMLAELGRVLRTRLFPIGMEGDHESVLAIDETGRVFALDHAGVWYLGDDMVAALTTLVAGSQPPRIDESGYW